MERKPLAEYQWIEDLDREVERLGRLEAEALANHQPGAGEEMRVALAIAGNLRRLNDRMLAVMVSTALGGFSRASAGPVEDLFTKLDLLIAKSKGH